MISLIFNGNDINRDIMKNEKGNIKLKDTGAFTEDGKWRHHDFISDVSSRELLMAIKIRKGLNGDIEVLDTGGIRIHLLNEKTDKGLWMYFNTRLTQYGS